MSVNDIHTFIYDVKSLKGVTKLLPEMINLDKKKYISKIIIPIDIKIIGKKCFQSFYQLKEVVIHEGVEIIEDHAFYGCSLLSIIKLPESLKQIGMGVFMYCSLLN